MHTCSSIAFAAVLAAALPAQLPQYFVTPAAKPGGAIQTALVGQAGHAFASWIDVGGGPTRFLGEEFFLNLSPALTLMDAGRFGIGGLHTTGIRVPSTGLPIGRTFYLQSMVLDPNAPNGSFRASNGETTVLYRSSQVMVEEFSDPVLAGYTGTFDRAKRYRIQGGAVTRRTHTIRPRVGVKFGQPIFGPLNPYGTRIQMVYRAVDLGARGDREVLTAMRWLPFGGKVGTARFKRLVIDVGHTRVVPDYSIDPRTAFPKFPNSGLNGTFANNPKPGETPLRVIDSAYAIKPGDVRKDGYVGYPAPRRDFVYNGFDSLLLDFKMEPTPNLTTTTGQQIQLMVTTSPRPDARVTRFGTQSAPVNPHTATTGRGDNSMTYMQFEFAKTETVAQGPWRKAPVASPDYHKPYLAVSTPFGTNVRVEFRGANDAKGTMATQWMTDINGVDRRPYLQFRITLSGNPHTGAVPSIESIVIPIN